MKTINTLLLLVIITWLLSSCSPVYYEPSTHNVPMLEEKGDFSFGGGTNVVFNKGEVQASYAITNHIGVMTNYMIKKYHLTEEEGDTRTSQMFEGGVGYFYNPNNRLVLEAYGLIGKGTFDNRIANWKNEAGTLSGMMTKYALQLSLGYREKGLELAYSLRPTVLKFSNVNGDLSYGGRDQKSLLLSKDNYTSIEHSFTARFVYESVKIQLQIGIGGRQFANGNHRLKSYLTYGMFFDLKKLYERNSVKK